MSGSTIQRRESSLAGRQVMLIGKLASMPRREAEEIIREHGGTVAERAGIADLVIVSDEAAGRPRAKSDRAQFEEDLCQRLASGEAELIGESALWARLGLVESGQGVERLYTLAMLAELIRAPIAAVRQWHRRRVIIAKREVQRLPYFDFEEVGVARKLAQLLDAGCSIAAIDRQLNALARLLPGIARPLLDPGLVVDGRCLYVRRGEGLAEPGGQLLIDFDRTELRSDDGLRPDGPATIPIVAGDALHKPSSQARAAHPHVAEDLRALAAELAGAGHPDQAVDAYRAVLFSGDATAEDHFAVAELLYEQGELAAARERYYVAIELDEEFVEARANLGCLLAELGELALAEAAFRGALEYHPDYADAHYHLARLLDRENRSAEAVCHWRLFMSLAPASPWADEARDRVGAE